MKRPDWESALALLGSLEEIEAFRVGLVLQGADTRSARLAITLRRNEILNLMPAKVRRPYRRKPKQEYKPHFGPFLPRGHPILVERERAMWAEQKEKMIEQMCQPNPFLQLLERQGRLVRRAR